TSGASTSVFHAPAGAHMHTDKMPVVAGQQYTASVYLRAASTTRNWAVGIRWYNNVGTQLGIDSGTSTPITSAGFTRLSKAATAPAGAVEAELTVDSTHQLARGDQFYIDDALFE